jgi:FtsP/CotA-like multicopper oxidase with cupredoxin domain
MDRRKVLLIASLFMTALLVVANLGTDAQAQTTSGAAMSATSASSTKTAAMKRVTPADRKAAAARASAARLADPLGRLSARLHSLLFGAAALDPLGKPDYFGTIPNYANSPLPRLDSGGRVIAGSGIRKFVDSLPGLGYAKRNNLGNYLPVATPDTTTYPGCDYYVIALVEYSQKLHSDLPATKLRGYMQVNTTDPNVGRPSYLGPTIVAQKDRPVRVKFINQLPTGSGGDLFLPVDTTVMGAGTGPDGVSMYKQNRATLHLHGGATPWISDGTPHQWTTPAGEITPYPKGVSVYNVPDMPDPGPGALTFFYTNQQSARLMFYHDHAYGMTRLNVYAGEAAGYLLSDPVEQKLVNGGTVGTLTVAPGTIPTEQIPLIIQDKSFVPTDTQLAAEDPTWDKAHWGGLGSLWFPHVYMPNQNPRDAAGVNAMGRWDYGPWFWPIFNPMNGPTAAGDPGTPNPSLTPEAFMDTPMVNGTPYPYVRVSRKAYRFRILNAANDRFFNLQLYYARANAPASVNAAGAPTLQTLSGEVSMVPAVPHAATDRTWPVTWPTDGRAGGVPDPRRAGPKMIQIGTEGGLLPRPVVINNQPIGYNYNRRDVVVLNVLDKSLMLGPAERADVIIDFSRVPDGTRIILYNDAPAPVPAFDPRYDYYTGDPNQTSMGGAPTTRAGYGPNTRTIMQFQVVGRTAAPAFNTAALQRALPEAYKLTQAPPIVPQKAYGAATDTFSGIQSTALTFTPEGATASVTVTMQRKAIQELFEGDYGRMNATLGTELQFTNSGNQTTLPFGYVDPATEIATDSVSGRLMTLGDGTQIWKITHNGVDTHAIHFHLFNVQLVNRVGWDGAIRPPDANELGWKETVRMNPLEDAIVALRPVAPTLPFKIGDSIRPLDPTKPLGTTSQFLGRDPLTGNPVTVVNRVVNFGWEYVWHCHLLGHEENDMMRPLVFQVSPAAPSTLTAVASAVGVVPSRVNLTWVDNSTVPTATNFYIERSRNVDFSGLVTTRSVPAPATTYADYVNEQNVTYYYRVRAENTNAFSTWSDVASATPAGVPDTTPPTTTSNAVASYDNSATILLTATDGVGGSGVDQTYYAIDGGPTQTGTTVVASTIGTHTLSFWSKDLAGNIESPRPTATFRIADTIAPATTSNAVATYYDVARIALTAIDTAGGSGVAQTNYSIDGGPTLAGTTVSVSSLGAHTLEFWSADLAGNVEFPHTTVAFTVLVGRISLNVAPSSGLLGRTFLLSGSVLPATPGGAVVVYIRRPGRTTYARWASPTLSASSTWSYSYRPTARGAYSIYAASLGHRSRTVSVLVR